MYVHNTHKVGHITYNNTHIKENAQNLSLTWVPQQKYAETTI